MAFLQEPEPARGVLLPVLPGIARLVARNPGVMTYHGTNTYFVSGPDGLSIIDPGPDDAAHVADILLLAEAGAKAGAESRIRRILLTHSHSDHMGAAAALQNATNAPILAYHTPMRADFTPDVKLDDGDAQAGFTALFTPGHAADHLCFSYVRADGRQILFSGDHVMSWSSSIVSPPEGDMLAYYRSLERVLARPEDELYLPGHGPLLAQPRLLAAELLQHRQVREASILAALQQKPWGVAALAAELYDKADPRLKAAAQRNVLAHLLKLQAEGIVQEQAPDAGDHPDTVEALPYAIAYGIPQDEINATQADARRRFRLK